MIRFMKFNWCRKNIDQVFNIVEESEEIKVKKEVQEGKN